MEVLILSSLLEVVTAKMCEFSTINLVSPQLNPLVKNIIGLHNVFQRPSIRINAVLLVLFHY